MWTRRQFRREFKVGAVKLVRQRGMIGGCGGAGVGSQGDGAMDPHCFHHMIIRSVDTRSRGATYYQIWTCVQRATGRGIVGEIEFSSCERQ